MTASSPRDVLLTCLAVPRWADEVTDQAPFASSDELLEAARSAAPLTASEVRQAISDHPRIGEAPRGDSASSEFSRREQDAVDASDAVLAAAIAAGNAEYERRFGRIFLIRAAGRSRAETLVELQRRLELNEAEDMSIVAAELVDIALLRIASLVTEGKL
jgi:2-oxo-4-hydroxy-4-carboxy-5-ureidoimidazoline decarboxylase